ncbi:unnamed protein product [Staurois parvus]|uniref:Transposase n=1 Tax=Staurois parvus TaxID=386267 RepID=A0ABN9EUL2_9NEOB|nr:unnamed protein product [Staurois parvus]
MGHSQKLSESKRGTVIGCHLCNKPICEISLLLNIPWPTVSGIITKWKKLGTTATRSGRPQKMTEQGQYSAQKSPTAKSTTKVLQTSCGLQISTTT